MSGPFIPGIPQLPAGAATPVIAALASEAISSSLWQASQSPPSWGVFQNQTTTASDGSQQQSLTQVLFPDSVLEFSNRQEYDVSNFPVQKGSFASYNKVIHPFEIQMRFSKGGTVSDRADFLDDIQALVESLELYTVIIPERTYENVNAVRSEVIRRGARGAFFLTEVDVYFVQIIEVTPQYTTTAVQLPNAQDPAAQPTANVGTVQPQNPDSQLQQDGQLALQSQNPLFYSGG